MSTDVQRHRANHYTKTFYPDPNGEWVRFTEHRLALEANRGNREKLELALYRIRNALNPGDSGNDTLYSDVFEIIATALGEKP